MLTNGTLIAVTTHVVRLKLFRLTADASGRLGARSDFDLALRGAKIICDICVICGSKGFDLDLRGAKKIMCIL